MNTPQRHICIITGTRAEWGLLSPLARQLHSRPDVKLSIIATNMHLMPQYGMTVHQIEADGFNVAARIPLNTPTDTPLHTAHATAQCLADTATALDTLRPDIIVILGDRYEMLAAATAATLLRIPIAHLHGGETSLGAIDDYIRHAITKLASLHLTSAETHRRRVIQMGEDPQTVFCTGAIGVQNALSLKPLPLTQIQKHTGINIDRQTLIVTYHPVTADTRTPAHLFSNLLQALDRFPLSTILFTYPNNDPRGQEIIPLIDSYVAHNPHRAVAFPSLGAHRYLSTLHYAGAVVGNSSSGIIEAPSLGIPTVDIGLRQKGRLAADTVIHCADTADSIAHAITHALLPATQTAVRQAAHLNPYYHPHAAQTAAQIIATYPLTKLTHKNFHDITPLPPLT